VSSASAPVWLRWRASDTTALRSVDLVAPVAATFAPTTTSYAGTARVGASTTWTLRAGDWAGNTATASVARTPLLGSETSATRTGTWSTLSSSSYLGGSASSSYLGGSALTSTAKGASLRWTFTGRSAAVVASRTPTSGQLAVWVDGIQVGTVDLLSSTTQHRRAVWTGTWSTAGTHTVRIVVVGTSGRPRVTADGLLRIG
jgi:hypothetical protein